MNHTLYNKGPQNQNINYLIIMSDPMEKFHHQVHYLYCLGLAPEVDEGGFDINNIFSHEYDDEAEENLKWYHDKTDVEGCRDHPSEEGCFNCENVEGLSAVDHQGVGVLAAVRKLSGAPLTECKGGSSSGKSMVVRAMNTVQEGHEMSPLDEYKAVSGDNDLKSIMDHIENGPANVPIHDLSVEMVEGLNISDEFLEKCMDIDVSIPGDKINKYCGELGVAPPHKLFYYHPAIEGEEENVPNVGNCGSYASSSSDEGEGEDVEGLKDLLHELNIVPNSEDIDDIVSRMDVGAALRAFGY